MMSLVKKAEEQIDSAGRKVFEETVRQTGAELIYSKKEAELWKSKARSIEKRYKKDMGLTGLMGAGAGFILHVLLRTFM